MDIMKGIRFRQVMAIIINVLLILAAIAVQIVYYSMKNALASQKAADRWSKINNYAQISVFLSEISPLSLEDIDTIRYNVDKELDQAGINADSDIPNSWIAAYSFEGNTTATREDKSLDIAVTAVGGSFFLFYPVDLVNGACFWESDISDDLVVIDENVAWNLYGSNDVVGMEIKIDEKTYIISGVSKCKNDFVSRSSYGDTPRVYMSYSSYAGFSKEESRITAYQVLLPNSIKGYAFNLMVNIFENSYSEKEYSIVENSDRYSLSNLFGIIRDFGKRSINVQAIYYPYWENAARMTEDYGALLIVLSILLLVYPFREITLLLHRFIKK